MFDVSFNINFDGLVFSGTEDAWTDTVENYFIQKYGKVSPEQLERILKLITFDLTENLVYGLNFDKTAVRPLKPATIKAKGNATPFLVTGESYKSVREEMLSEVKGINFIDSGRDDILTYLNFGTEHIEPMPFFGISQKALDEIDKILVAEGTIH